MSGIPGCVTVQVNRTVNTEGGRIAQLLENAQICARAVALAKARANQGCPPVPVQRQDVQVPRSSDWTAGRTACLNYVSPNTFVPEKTWIANLQRAVIDKGKDPLNPETRFASYNRPIPPPVCPAIPQEALNANVPKNQGLRCPLPNRPDLIVLPG